MRTKTFLDSGVLIAASRADHTCSVDAQSVLKDPTRDFIVSAFLRLEIIPQATFNNRPLERAFYEGYLDAAISEVPVDVVLTDKALDLACNFGLHAVDSLHVAAAMLGGAAEFITTEKPNKRMFNVRGGSAPRFTSLYRSSKPSLWQKIRKSIGLKSH